MLNAGHGALNLIAKELRTQYAGSVLGRLWWFFSPFFQMALYALVFGIILKSRPMVGTTEVPYVVYLCCGLLPWTVWSGFLSRSPQLFLENAHYIRKIRLPKILFLLQGATIAFIPLLVALPLFLALSWALGFAPSLIGVLSLVLVTLAGLFLCCGIAMALAYLNVFIRDVSQLVPFVLQVVFWSLPICYAQPQLTGGLKQVLQLNPFSGLIDLAHSSYLNQKLSSGSDLTHAGLMILLFWVVGLFVAYRTDKWVVDEL